MSSIVQSFEPLAILSLSRLPSNGLGIGCLVCNLSKDLTNGNNLSSDVNVASKNKNDFSQKTNAHGWTNHKKAMSFHSKQ